MVSYRIFPFRAEWLVREGPAGRDVLTIDDFRWWMTNSGSDFRHSESATAGDVFLFAWKEQPAAWAIVGEAIVREVSASSGEKLRFRISTETEAEVYPKWVPWVRISPGERTVEITRFEYEAIRGRATRSVS